ncbi:MAG: response regulator [Lentisphaeraceae bacterium]|nr:response regulator [Lentisphaeraceae bacterium]
MNENFLILLTEDDDAAANLIQMNLKRLGAKNILWKQNGKEALDYLNSSFVEGEEVIILLDIKMPVMDGFQLLQQVKGNSKYKNIPVVMLTTTDNPEEVEKCYSLGCNFYIKKPVEYRELTEKLKAFMNFAKICVLPQ